ncbi:hypothetical protein MHBO_001250, partial [Bonamia ostreae]
KVAYAKVDSDIITGKKSKLAEKREIQRKTDSAPAVSESPNNVLFLQNLPKEINAQTLISLFGKYQGFRQVRMIESKPGIAFVDFHTSFHAGVALSQLQDYPITEKHLMNVSYAKAA